MPESVELGASPPRRLDWLLMDDF
ncbi:mCG1051093 [Mus musculus]|nr:mCG1051093 [Mus musculus]